MALLVGLIFGTRIPAHLYMQSMVCTNIQRSQRLTSLLQQKVTRQRPLCCVFHPLHPAVPSRHRYQIPSAPLEPLSLAVPDTAFPIRKGRLAHVASKPCSQPGMAARQQRKKHQGGRPPAAMLCAHSFTLCSARVHWGAAQDVQAAGFCFGVREGAKPAGDDSFETTRSLSLSG